MVTAAAIGKTTVPNAAGKRKRQKSKTLHLNDSNFLSEPAADQELRRERSTDELGGHNVQPEKTGWDIKELENKINIYNL